MHDSPLQTILVGKSIQLEPLQIVHYEPLQHAANDHRIWLYMPMRADGDSYDAWFQECLLKQNKGFQLTFVIRRLIDKTIIGSRAYFDIDFRNKKCEVGYGWLTPAVWGKHYNHESLLLLFQHAFEQWQMNRLQIATDPLNTKNYNNLKKLGAIEEGLLRQHMIHHNGSVSDTVLFSILATEWPEVKKKLAARLLLSVQ